MLVVRIEEIEQIEWDRADRGDRGNRKNGKGLRPLPFSFVLLLGVGRVVLFHDAFLKVFGEVGAYFLGGTLGCYLCHVTIYHDVYEFLETGL